LLRRRHYRQRAYCVLRIRQFRVTCVTVILDRGVWTGGPDSKRKKKRKKKKKKRDVRMPGERIARVPRDGAKGRGEGTGRRDGAKGRGGSRRRTSACKGLSGQSRKDVALSIKAKSSKCNKSIIVPGAQ
jgi:hypothetical protein